jgi:hypothetical protein
MIIVPMQSQQPPCHPRSDSGLLRPSITAATRPALIPDVKLRRQFHDAAAVGRWGGGGVAVVGVTGMMCEIVALGISLRADRATAINE